jgi:hypothetical protein
MKKLLIIGLFLALVFSVVPMISDAQKGLVQCGGENQPPCQVCSLFELLDNIQDFLLVPSDFNNNAPPIPIIGAIFLLIGGFYLLAAAGSPERLQKAKTILTATIVGLVIIYSAWLLMGAVLSSVGVAKWGNFTSPQNWLQVECNVDLSPKKTN